MSPLTAQEATQATVIPDPTAEEKGRPKYQAVRVLEPPKLDGLLDDPAWRLAPAGGPLLQFEPEPGAPMSEQTEFRILYDDEHLYLGIWCYDSEPDKILARIMERDDPLSVDDYVIFVFDTFHDRRNGYFFQVNPNGARRDALISDNVNFNRNWDGVWEAKASRDQEGWKVEVVIPLRSISFDPKASAWGFNISRTIKRKFEQGRWSEPHRNIITENVSAAGELTGLSGLRQGLGLEFSPYALGRFSKTKDPKDTDLSGDAGADLRYRITPNLAASFSYNTDFAETEVDRRRINLTRFPLFFPEKRAFFLEDSGIFEFGGLESELIPFFSRRIGLSSEGEIVPIRTAAKLTGRVNRYNLGVLHTLIESENDEDQENLLVTRVSRNVFAQSTAGMIATYGDPNSAQENALFGPDFRFRTTEFLGRQTLEANAFGLASFTEGGDPEVAPAFGTSLSYPNDLIRAGLQFYEIGEGFNPALGFVPRQATRAYTGEFGYRPRPEASDWIRQWQFNTLSRNYTGLDNSLDSATYAFYPTLVFESSDLVYIGTKLAFDSPHENFEMVEGVVVPAGDYWWKEFEFGFQTASKRTIAGGLYCSVGEFYDGYRQYFNSELDVLPWKHLGFSVDYSLNLVQLPAGDFSTQIAAFQMQWNFTPDLIWSHLLQYDTVSETAGYNGRIQWEYRPGARIFLVTNQNIGGERTFLAAGDAEVILKLGGSFRF